MTSRGPYPMAMLAIVLAFPALVAAQPQVGPKPRVVEDWVIDWWDERKRIAAELHDSVG
jgi:signal transduction histidine kinase